MGWNRSRNWQRISTSESFHFVAEIPQQRLARGFIGILLDALWRRSVDHAHDAAALPRFRHDNLKRVCRSAEDAADFRTHFNGIEHIDRERVSDQNRKH